MLYRHSKRKIVFHYCFFFGDFKNPIFHSLQHYHIDFYDIGLLTWTLFGAMFLKRIALLCR